MNNFVSDLRRAFRVLRASPGLVLISVLSLGLGVGVNLTLFSVIQAALFYQPDVADPDRVVGVEPGNGNQFSYLNYRNLQESGIFESVFGFRPVQLNLRAGETVERVPSVAVTANFFEAVGVSVTTGRTFRADEAAAERQPRLAVLAHSFWRQRFGGGEDVIGRSVTINGEPFAIIGVLPEGYRPIVPLAEPAIYVPLSALVLPTIDDRRNGNALNVLGRLHPGATPEQAQAAVTLLGLRLSQAYPEENGGMEQPAAIVPLRVRGFGGWQVPLVISGVLLLLVGLVLLSACANVAGLLLARIAHRQRELAVRVALGAGRGRLVRMLITESFGLALLGALAGGVLFLWLSRVLRTVSLPALSTTLDLPLEIDGLLVAYALGLTFLTAALCGLVPAWRATKTDVVSDIKSGDAQTATGRLGTRHLFVVGQVAVSLILLVLSSLLLRSLTLMTSIDPGFDVDRVAVATVNVDANRYAIDGGLPLAERLVERVQALPGVEAASFSGILALGTDQSSSRLQVEGLPQTAGSRTYLNSVGPQYFAALGIPFVGGRDFEAGDRMGAPLVGIVNEAFARSYFPGQNALGKRIRWFPRDPFFEIVGVVRDSNYGSIGEAPTPIFYAAYTQRPQISTQIRPVIMYVRTTGAPAAILPDLRRAVTEVDSTVFVQVQTLRDATSSEAQLRRFATQMIGTVGIVALLLSTIGLYGALAFVVSTRTREIGTRMALGAGARRILWSILAQGLRLVAVGIVVGSVLSWMLARALIAGLAGLSPADPLAFVGAILILAVVALAACYVPARRAASLDPVEALRVD